MGSSEIQPAAKQEEIEEVNFAGIAATEIQEENGNLGQPKSVMDVYGISREKANSEIRPTAKQEEADDVI